MKKLLTSIKNFLFGNNNISLDEIYLSHAVSLADLERRQQELLRGAMPWQQTKTFF